MHSYTVSQWLLFFFWYCFLGWIWESVYVSCLKAYKNKKWKWINRGFLNGPLLPIYGTAAIVILLATIPFKDSVPLIYCFGMLAATSLELITGSTMERIFHVKYWDYSNLPLNFHGYICFFVSLFWGFFSVLLVKVIHLPMENIILQMPVWLAEALALVLTAAFAFDFNASLREALDLRDLLEKISEKSQTLQRLENRFDAYVAFAEVPDLNDLRAKTFTAKERMVLNLDCLREKQLSRFRTLKDYIDQRGIEELPDRDELLEQIRQQMQGMFSRTNTQFWHVKKHLKRNPGAISKKYADAFKEIKELFEDK